MLSFALCKCTAPQHELKHANTKPSIHVRSLYIQLRGVFADANGALMTALAWADCGDMQSLLHDLLSADVWGRHERRLRLEFLRAVCEAPIARGDVLAGADASDIGLVNAACEAMRYVLVSDRTVLDLLMGGPATSVGALHDETIKLVNQLVMRKQEETLVALMALQSPGRSWAESALH